MALIKTQALSELIGIIHDAGLMPTLWPEAIERLCAALSGSAALLCTPQHTPEGGGMVIPIHLSGAAKAACTSLHHQLALVMQTRGGSKLLAPGMVLTDEDSCLRRLLPCGNRKFLWPATISRLCTATIFGPDKALVPPAVISIFRGLDAPPFGRAERNLLRLLISQLARSLRLMYRLRDAERQLAASLAVLDKLVCGVVLFDRQGNIVHANWRAGSLFEENDGVTLEERFPHGPRLTAASESLTASLHRLVTDAVSASGAETGQTSHGLRLPRKSGGPPIVLALSPLPPHHVLMPGTEQALAIGFLIDTDLSSPPDTGLLAAIYGLTPAESRLVGELCSGLAPRDIGERHGVSTETLKSQLKSIFAKTGMRRQVEVVRLAGTLSLKR